MTQILQDLAVYVHWPYCLAKCPYCDFNSHVRKTTDDEAMCGAILTETDHFAALIGRRNIKSIFFGGGTPSLMSGKIVGQIIDKLAGKFNFDSDIEITLEANPTSVEAAKFSDFSDAGVNRVSLGIQALNDKDLKALGREHSVKEARGAIELSQKYFTRSSFDLIYARMGQSAAEWEAELTKALSIVSAGHLSLYQLTIEQGTAFYNAFNRGKLILPDENLSAEMYDLTGDICDAAGMPSYEISNYARSGEESRHNLAYWNYKDYVGIGAGAHGRITYDGTTYATSHYKKPEHYIAHVAEFGHATEFHDALTVQMKAEEMIMMGLRLRKGINADHFKARTGKPLSDFMDQKNVKDLTVQGFIIEEEDHLRLTDQGLPLLNHILGKILA